MATNPTLLTQPIAANGAKNVIPNTTSTAGAMSQDQGFPAETALPLGAGGVAPTREDFNGAFNLLSGIAFMAQKGWVFLFDENQDYFAGCTVRDPLDSKIYEAINDVSASSTHPSADSVNWKLGTDMSAYTTTVNSPMFNKRDTITTSGTYTAPVTGWYKITAKGGGGGGLGGGVDSGSRFAYSGGGGGEGGTIIAYDHMTAGDTVPVTIGAGGNGSAIHTTPATDGGDSSVVIGANTYTGGGGNAGTRKGGAGGTGTIYGASGGTGSDAQGGAGAYVSIQGGVGGGNGGGVGSNGDASPATVGVNGGGGGGGGASTNRSYSAGGAGGDGYVWFEYFDSTLNP